MRHPTHEHGGSERFHDCVFVLDLNMFNVLLSKLFFLFCLLLFCRLILILNFRRLKKCKLQEILALVIYFHPFISFQPLGHVFLVVSFVFTIVRYNLKFSVRVIEIYFFRIGFGEMVFIWHEG